MLNYISIWGLSSGSLVNLVMSGVLMFFVMALMFQMKHFVCDYIVQTGAIAVGKGAKTGWVAPLSKHCLAHAWFTFVVCMISWNFGQYVSAGTWAPLGLVVAASLALALFDFIVHFIVDRLKASYSRGIGTDDSRFWVALGFDQLVHHATHYLIILTVLYLYLHSFTAFEVW